MLLEQVKIKGFRNFKDATINFCEKSLIIGANEVGKTNLLYAIRILLDKSLSEADIEPQDSDFYAYEDTNEFSIVIKFSNVVEDCILAKLKEKVSEQKELFLGYIANRNPITRAKIYKLVSGISEDQLEEITERFYCRVLNIKYISSTRNLFSYIAKEKKYLLQDAKKRREETQVKKDDRIVKKIETNLNNINDDIENLSYIKNATASINKELEDLSFQNESQEVVFDVGAYDTSSFIDNLEIASRHNTKSLAVGGDGRNNQIFIALFASRNEIQAENPLEVTIYCIEEPEAHLHPHQQRKLAESLATILKGQVILTNHAISITAEFSPNSIIKLYAESNESKAANDGCGLIIAQSFIEFGHRLTIIPAEAFFANVVLLVEGSSEELLYKALAKELKIDLDRLNISILMVDGVGFKVYYQILKALAIKCVVVTDNDINKIPKKDEYRYAGVQRSVKLFREYCFNPALEETIKSEKIIKDNESMLTGFSNINPPDENAKKVEIIIKELKKYNIFLSKRDLEYDLLSSALREDIKDFYDNNEDENIIKAMQKRKATQMFKFLMEKNKALEKLKSSAFEEHLCACKKLLAKKADD